MHRRQLRAALARPALALLLTLTTAAACQAPDHREGLYVARPSSWGRDMIAIYDGTFSDTARDIRIRTHTLPGELLAANLEYPTSGAKNRGIDPIIDEHRDFLVTYLEEHPRARVTLTGFSQGGCLVLDMVNRLRAAELASAHLDRISLVLIAPARGVRMGRSTEVAKRMIERCAQAERALVTTLEREPAGSIATLLRERTWIAWSCDDGIVGHDTLTELQPHIPSERLLYRARLDHLQWTGEDLDVSEAREAYLATIIAQAVAQATDPRAAAAPYGGFDAPCEACSAPAGPMDARCPNETARR